MSDWEMALHSAQCTRALRVLCTGALRVLCTGAPCTVVVDTGEGSLAWLCTSEVDIRERSVLWLGTVESGTGVLYEE